MKHKFLIAIFVLIIIIGSCLSQHITGNPAEKSKAYFFCETVPADYVKVFMPDFFNGYGIVQGRLVLSPDSKDVYTNINYDGFSTNFINKLNPHDKMNNNKIIIQILYDDILYDTIITPAYGFSCFIHFENENILFDTGTEGEILLENMKKCGISPDSVEKVVISHNHTDHMGGLRKFFRENPDVSIYMSREKIPNSSRNAINIFNTTMNLARHKIVTVPDSASVYKISEKVYSTGFFGDRIIEQSLILDTDKGLIIITGCAHQGIVNVVRKAKNYFNKPVYSVSGGFHLASKSKNEIRQIIKELKEMGVINCVPMHCTGQKAIEMIRSDFGGNFLF